MDKNPIRRAFKKIRIQMIADTKHHARRGSLRGKTVLLIGHRAFDESDPTSPLGGDTQKAKRIWDWRRRHREAESAAGFPVVSFRRAGSAAYIIATFGQRRFCEDSSVHDSDVCFFSTASGSVCPRRVSPFLGKDHQRDRYSNEREGERGEIYCSHGVLAKECVQKR